MSTPKYVFYLIYFIFHVFLVGGSIYMMNKLGESDYGWINGFVTGDNLIFNETNIILFSILGLILFVINVVMVNIQIRTFRKRNSKLESEINSLKAKMYDLQEAKQPASKKPVPPSGESRSGDAPTNKPLK